jgi:molecular chaperone GrpE (heat shock protein)
MEIRGKCISYSSYIKKKSTEKEKLLLTQIDKLEEKYEENIQTINSKKKDLENIRNHKLMGNMIRLNAKWINEGEKPTNYFLNLESRHFTNKIIPKLNKENGNEEVTVQKDILLEIENYYRSLYQNRNEQCDFDLNKILFDINCPVLNDVQKHPWKVKSHMKKQQWF